MKQSDTIKAERFRRVAFARTDAVMSCLRKLGNCSALASYRYTQRQVETIFAAIEKEMQKARALFANPSYRGKPQFRMKEERSKEGFVQTQLTKSKMEAAMRCLEDNGIESDETEVVLQALCYILLDTEIENIIGG